MLDAAAPRAAALIVRSRTTARFYESDCTRSCPVTVPRSSRTRRNRSCLSGPVARICSPGGSDEDHRADDERAWTALRGDPRPEATRRCRATFLLRPDRRRRRPGRHAHRRRRQHVHRLRQAASACLNVGHAHSAPRRGGAASRPSALTSTPDFYDRAAYEGYRRARGAASTPLAPGEGHGEAFRLRQRRAPRRSRTRPRSRAPTRAAPPSSPSRTPSTAARCSR